MIVLKSIFICLFISMYQCKTPDKVYCVNQECSEPISKAKTLLKYNSGDKDFISFPGKSDATIYMKSAGTNADLWYAEINGQTGFVNSKFLREYKVFEKSPQFIVPIDVKSKPQVQPDKVQQAHEVFEGTTIFSTEASPPQSPSPLLAPSSESAESFNKVADFQQDSVQNEDSNVQNAQSNVGTRYEVLMNQNNNDMLEQSNTEITANQDNIIENQETDIPIQTMTTSESPINIDNPKEQTFSSLEQNQELPSAIPESLPSPQPMTSSSNENIVTPENLVEIPNIIDSLPQNIQNPEFNSNDLNTSVPSNLIKNVENNLQPVPETPSVVNLTSQQMYVTPQPSSENVMTPQVPEVIAPPTQHENNLLNNFNYGDNNDIQDSNAVPVEDVQMAAPQVIDTIPPAFVNTETISSTESVPIDNIQSLPVSTEASDGATTESILAHVESVPVAVETIVESTTSQEDFSTTSQTPLLQSAEESTLSTETITETLFQTEKQSSTAQVYEVTTPTPYEEVTQSTPYEEVTQSTPYEEVTQSTPYESIEIESNTETYTSTSTESNDDIHRPTEAPIQDSYSKSFLSDIYSTLADIWPYSTEAPPQESIFNPEFIHKDEPEVVESSESFSFMAYIIAAYKTVMGSREESRALFATPGETCYKDEYCDGESTENKNRLLTFLVTTAASVLLFTLGYYYIDNRRQDSRLIGTINSLQRDLLFSTKECEILKEELTSTKSKLAGIEDSSFGMDDMVLSLKEEINELKAQNERLRKSLDDNEKLLRVSENTASELQNTLGDVENTLSELLVERANTEEQIAELNAKVQAFEEELMTVSRDRDNFQLKYVSAESALEETKKQKKQLEELNKKLSEAQNTIELQKHEIAALKDVVKELKSGGSSDVDVNSLIDHTEIKAKLSKATEEKDTYLAKYEIEHKERVRLSEELAVTQESLQTTTQQATEALTRLEVLGKYFQQRESELMKELNAKESLWLSKQGESASTIEKMEILQQEAQRYKEKCDALTLELAEQESMRRTAISEMEARAHTAWLEARQAKRDADAAKDEAAALRRKLASLHQADGAVSPHRPVASPLEMVDSPMLPPPMLPLSFMPPPILPPLPRPPPLGRLPSPRPSRYDRDYGSSKRYTPLSHPDSLRHSPDFEYPPSDYPPPSDYVLSEREYDRRDGRSSGRSARERGSSWERERDTETEYHSDSPSRRRRRRRRYTRHSGHSSASSHTESEDSAK